MMHFRPDLVDLELLPDGELDIKRDGMTPNAREATDEHGAELVRIFLEQGAPKVKALIEEALAGWPKTRADGN